MTLAKRILLLMLVTALTLSLTACGGKKTVDLNSVTLSEDKSLLIIEYVAKGDISASEGAFRISVSSTAGEVYSISNLDDDLKKNSQSILMFSMRSPLVGMQKEWKVGKTVKFAGGTQVTGSISTDDILKLFGDSSVITVAFQVNQKTVAEKSIPVVE